MRKLRIHTILLCALAVTLLARPAFASESSGTILDSAKLTKICKTTDCSSFGNVNWKPTLNADTTGATPVTITDTAVSGWLWGDEIGWVNMQPTGAGVTVAPNTGELSGEAYANVGSWINFSPTTAPGDTPVGVSINSQGQFTGWAYVSGLNGGWMKFDCSDPTTCIETDWRPIPNRTLVTVSPPPANGPPGMSSWGTSAANQLANLKAIYAYNGLPMPGTVATTLSSATLIFTRSLKLGMMGEDVRQLQAFLNEQGFTVAETGPGSPGNETDFFGPATKAALIRFQDAHAADILAPSGLTAGNGLFGPMTLQEVQNLIAASLSSATSTPQSASSTAPFTFTRTLQVGSTGDDVRQLQVFLNGHGFTVAASGPGSLGEETDTFGLATKGALMKFQLAHRTEILDPAGFTAPTGIFGPLTRKLVNAMK